MPKHLAISSNWCKALNYLAILLRVTSLKRYEVTKAKLEASPLEKKLVIFIRFLLAIRPISKTEFKTFSPSFSPEQGGDKVK